MGTYNSFIVHLASSAFLYFAALYGLRFIERRWGKPAKHWLRLSQPALLVIMVALIFEVIDRNAHGLTKAIFDVISWLVGLAASVVLANWIYRRRPLD